jgi:hypothetical protein
MVQKKHPKYHAYAQGGEKHHHLYNERCQLDWLVFSP